MRTLPADLRKELETAVLSARRAAESACRAALDMLGVFTERRPEHLDMNQAAVRNGLRAKWRQLGGDRELLVTECAYEQWHRLLFARFLAENNLLLHPQYKTPVTLNDCDDLAAELGESDGWSVAARFAAEILPGIFRLDDPCVLLRLAPEGRYELEQILASLPAEILAADDALGWVYQFWQKDKKDEINASERKIGGADLGPVTQLFTENYMVRFLLENSLGAWWAVRHPDSPLIKEFKYMRINNEGDPEAGPFDSWPDRVAQVTVMDPCCGSGHFLVEAFSMLWRMRAEEEGIGSLDAQDYVLRDNLFGLELDHRCVEIAMFAIVLQAWKSGNGWRQLPIPNVACSGTPVRASVDEWRKFADGDERLQNALSRLHILFGEADTLGSLIDPRRTSELIDPTGRQRSFDDVDWDEIAPLLIKASAQESNDPATRVLGQDAVGIARAAEYLSRHYTLVATNVPFRQKATQDETLRRHAEQFFFLAREDLATIMLERFRSSTLTMATVSPMTWLSLGRYEQFRREIIDQTSLHMIVRLGARAFEGISGEAVKVALILWSATPPAADQKTVGMDVSDVKSASQKDRALNDNALQQCLQAEFRANPMTILTLDGRVRSQALLQDFAVSLGGITSGDSPRYRRAFWEVEKMPNGWVRQQLTPLETAPFTGRWAILDLEEAKRAAENGDGATIAGSGAWGRQGVAVRYTGNLPVTLYSGEYYENVIAVIIPNLPADLPAIWYFCCSPEFGQAVRRLDNTIGVKANTVAKVPFDVDHWRRVAESAGSLPTPWSNDPTQWLFNGHPASSTAPLHVAIIGLLGYRWPQQPDCASPDSYADVDGIVCLPAVGGEASAFERLQQLLPAAFGDAWFPGKDKELLLQAGGNRRSLADWLRDDFFRQHCVLFGNRPFIWHIWDGLQGGFSALVNYHRLDRKLLEKLTYTYLGQDWVERQRAAASDEVPGAETRLSAALALQRKLEAILEGENPYDIYVRWKEVYEQPIGWEPDLNDGVRLNIRPFVEAGVLRSPFNIHWRKDRGKNPDGTERLNDIHLSLAEKRAARHRVRPR